MNRNVSLSSLAPLHGDAAPDPEALLRTGADHQRALTDAQMLADESQYCSYGDTVHYSEPPRIFGRCDGSYLYDTEEVP